MTGAERLVRRRWKALGQALRALEAERGRPTEIYTGGDGSPSVVDSERLDLHMAGKLGVVGSFSWERGGSVVLDLDNGPDGGPKVGDGGW